LDRPAQPLDRRATREQQGVVLRMAAQSVLQDRIGRRVPCRAKERLRDVGVRLGRAAGAVQERAVIAARTRLVALRDQDLALENLEIEVVREAARGLGEHAPGLIGLSTFELRAAEQQEQLRSRLAGGIERLLERFRRLDVLACIYLDQADLRV